MRELDLLVKTTAPYIGERLLLPTPHFTRGFCGAASDLGFWSDFKIESNENFNRWPGSTWLCRHSLVHGLAKSKGFSPKGTREKKWIGKEKTRDLRANSVGIARFSDSDSFPIHFFPRPDIKLNPFDSDRPCTRLCRHNKVGPGHLLKFSLNSIPKSAVFRAFLTEFSLNSISKIICLFAGHLLKEESQPSPDSD